MSFAVASRASLGTGRPSAVASEIAILAVAPGCSSVPVSLALISARPETVVSPREGRYGEDDRHIGLLRCCRPGDPPLGVCARERTPSKLMPPFGSSRTPPRLSFPPTRPSGGDPSGKPVGMAVDFGREAVGARVPSTSALSVALTRSSRPATSPNTQRPDREHQCRGDLDLARSARPANWPVMVGDFSSSVSKSNRPFQRNQCHAGSGCRLRAHSLRQSLISQGETGRTGIRRSWMSVPLPEAPPVGVALKVASSLPRRPAGNRAASAVRVASTVGAVRAPVILPSRAR